MSLFLKGILIGLLFGVPVGAVGAMTVQRTWEHGIKAGLLTGTGRFKIFLSSFAVGIMNPAAILTFLFAFSWFGIAGGSVGKNGWLVVLGVHSQLSPKTTVCTIWGASRKHGNIPRINA